MAEFIPNQPISIGTGSVQPCLNNDTRAYAMLMQGEEEWKHQVLNSPCDGVDGSVCDPDMKVQGRYLVTSGFTDPTEWTTQDATINTIAGFANLFVQPALNQAYINRTISTDTYYGTSIGRVCKCSFYVNGIVSSANTVVTVASSAGAMGNVLHYSGVPVAGTTVEFYCYIPGDNSIIELDLIGDEGDAINIGSFNLQLITPCWKTAVDTNGLTIDPVPFGVSLASSSAWTYDFDGIIGTFTSVPNWNTWTALSFPYNTLAVELITPFTPGETVELTYTLTNVTAGSIYPYLGIDAGISRSTNGTFTESITDNAGIGHLAFFTTQDFSGSLRVVSIRRTANCHTYDILNASDNSEYITNILPGFTTTHAEMVINPSAIVGDLDDVPGTYALPDGCYKIRFNDCCSGESTISDTVINYTTGTHDCTVLIDAVCEDKALGFDFSLNFSLTHRVRVVYFNPIFRNDGEDYTGSDGMNRKIFARSEKFYTALFDYCDGDTHSAINAQLLSDTLTFDGIEFFCRTKDYQPDWAERGKLNLSQSQIELQKQNPVIFNRNCI